MIFFFYAKEELTKKRKCSYHSTLKQPAPNLLPVFCSVIQKHQLITASGNLKQDTNLFL